MNRKRIVHIFSFITVLIIMLAAAYMLSFPVKLNMVTLDKTISQYLAHGNGISRNVEFLGTGVGIDNNEYFLISVDEQFGYVCFESGPFGRHRIRNVSYGGGTFRKGIIESKGKKYLLFAGLDSGNVIDRIIVEIQGDVYELNLGKHRPFFDCIEIDSNTTETYVDLNKITFYDKNNLDITHLYDLGGGAFQ